ncbi:MAG: PDDEXK nuclease domain-containing protein, partial [Nanoarchaeota archaeon]|nr:PDDEXK nuclease domain-containing protein [Nanoarchaeota archaeon]
MKTRKFIIKKELKNYGVILEDIRSLLERAKLRAYKAVDNIRVQTYWQVGERIAREEFEHKGRADYGKRVIESLADDLRCSRAIMFEIVQFYRAYPIVHTLYGQLSWSHYRVLIKIKNKEEKIFYENSSIRNSWSVRELREQIKKQTAKKYKKVAMIKLSPNAAQLLPQDVFKNSYDFDFLELKQDFKEKDLKDALLSRFEAFIKELGSDFFIGRREVPVLIGGNYDKVDLELFHAGLMCYILVEIKIEEFKHSHASQM